MAELTRRAFLSAVALVVLPAHHRPNHKGGPPTSPSPSPSPEPSVGLYGDTYSLDY